MSDMQHPPERPGGRPTTGPANAPAGRRAGGAGPADSPMDQLARPDGNVFKASAVMIVLSLLLFWLPVIGPGLAGFLGGRIAASGVRALLTAILPMVLLAALIIWILTAFDLRVLAWIAGIGTFLYVLVQNIPLLVGAYAGGKSAEPVGRR